MHHHSLDGIVNSELQELNEHHFLPRIQFTGSHNCHEQKISKAKCSFIE